MKNIVIIGSGGHFKVISDIIEKEGKYRILGLIDDNKDIDEKICGYPILGGINHLNEIADDIYGGIIAVGDNWTRYLIMKKILEVSPNFKFIKAVHPQSIIGKEVFIGDGTVVMAGAIINPYTNIGMHCIINTKSSIDHDNSLGDFVTIAPSSTTGGFVRIGDFSVISLNAGVIHNKTIGEHTVIGAGSIVLKDMPAKVLSYGNPAKIIRERSPGDKYL